MPGPGREILATAELVHLAGAVDDITYVAKGAGPAQGGGRPDRGRLWFVTSLVDRDRARRFTAVIASQEERDGRAGLVLTAAAVVVVLAAALTVVSVLRTDDPGTVALPPGGVAVIDPDSGRLVDAVGVGGDPEGVAAGDGDLWVVQAGSDSVARIDPESGRLVRTVDVGRVPAAVASSSRDVWVVNTRGASVSRISTATNRVVQAIGVGNRPAAVATGLGSVWVANGNDATVTRIDARSGQVTGEAQVGRGPAGVAVGAGVVWVSNSRDGTVSPVDPRTLEVGAPIRVGAGPKGITVAPSGVWVANRLELTVSRIGVRSRQVRSTRSPWATRRSPSPRTQATNLGHRRGRGCPGTDRRATRAGRRLAGAGRRAVRARQWPATGCGPPPGPSPQQGTPAATLRVAMEDQYAEGLRSLDPVLYVDPAILTLLHDGLLGFRRAGGADNLDLAPSLAVGIPTPTARWPDLHLPAAPPHPLLRRPTGGARRTSGAASNGTCPSRATPLRTPTTTPSSARSAAVPGRADATSPTASSPVTGRSPSG